MRFLHKNPELYGGAAGLSEPVKEKTGQTFFPSAWSSFSVEGGDLCAERAGCHSGFSQLKALEFFVFRKMEMPETENHLLRGWCSKCL